MLYVNIVCFLIIISIMAVLLVYFGRPKQIHKISLVPKKFYSQHGQDEFVYKRFFKDKKTPGVFLEIGADDGIRFSNCKFFEETLKWTGLAIEARTSAFEKLKENRSCICENVVLSNVEEKTQFMDISGYGLGLSGLVNKYDPKHQKRISKEIKNKENKGFKIVDVQTVTLNNILDKHNIRNVDFLSIDTEGSELDILSTLDFSKYNIDVITIEDNYNDPKLINFFERRNYSLVKKIQCDKIFQKNITKLSVFFDCTWKGCNAKTYKSTCDNSTPSSNGHWKNIRSTANVDEADYIIGMDGLSKKEYEKKKFIILPREPFGKYKSFYEDTIHAVVFTQGQGCLSFDQAKNLEYESRNKLCSMIVSSKISRPPRGIYKQRVAFTKKVDKTKLVDIFGKGWDKNSLKNRYFGELNKKKKGLLDYKYSICIENSKTKNYFSEKITEALLCFTMPIYCGCPNILEYFPQDSLYVIDIEKENVMDDVREILKKPITDKHVAAMKKARNLILEKYNLFEVVRQKINSQMLWDQVAERLGAGTSASGAEQDITILVTTHKTNKQLDCLNAVLLSVKAYFGKDIPILICHDSNNLNKNDKKEVVEKFNNLKRIFNIEWYFGNRTFNFNDIDYSFNTVGCNMLDLILKCKTKFFLLLEHDWLFLQKVNVGNIIDLLNRNLNINYIRFSQRDHEGAWDRKTKYIEEYDLTSTNGFTNHPYISRKSFWTNYLIDKLIAKRVKFVEDVVHDFNFCLMGLFLYKKIGKDTIYIKHVDGSDRYNDRPDNNTAKGYTKEKLKKISINLIEKINAMF